MKEIVFGSGQVQVEAFVYDGKHHALLLRPVSELHKVGEFVAGNDPVEPQAGDTILWFRELGSLRIVQDELSRVALMMQNVIQPRGDVKAA
jgi:hypothetical protein